MPPSSDPDNAFDSSNFEDALRRLREIGTPIKIKPYRQIWSFPYAGRTLYLKWFPRAANAAKSLVRGANPAKIEYDRLVQLQKVKIPAPRALTYLSGMLLDGEKGDAVTTLAIENSEPLDAILHRAKREATLIPGRREIAAHLAEILQALSRNNLGHSDLHFRNFLVQHTKLPATPGEAHTRLFLLDPSALHEGPVTEGDLSVLAHASRGTTTRTERLRLWRAVTPPNTPAPREPMAESKHFWRKRVGQVTPRKDTDHIGHLRFRDYAGLFFKNHRFPHRHSRASALTITADDWLCELPRLFEQLDGELLTPLKRSPSADVFAGTLTLAGVPLDVVVKRPKRKYAYRYLTEIGRGSRALRAWRKSWMLALRNLPVAWPLLMLERKILGIATDQLFIAERVPGKPLSATDLDALAPPNATPAARDRLLRRLGAVLRQIDDTGLVHFDTKASNFIAMPDARLGPTPVCIDPDGIRPYSWRGEGLRRLLQSLQEHHPQYTPEDGLSLLLGYDFTLRRPEVQKLKSEMRRTHSETMPQIPNLK